MFSFRSRVQGLLANSVCYIRPIRVHFPNENPVALRRAMLSTFRFVTVSGGGTDEDLGHNRRWFFLGLCVNNNGL
jgi:hypothetical protein